MQVTLLRGREWMHYQILASDSSEERRELSYMYALIAGAFIALLKVNNVELLSSEALSSTRNW